MKNLTAPLTDKELNRLDRLLLDRVDEDADPDEVDEGILDTSELDGFFTALVSGPMAIPPSRWLPAIWGDFPPVWATKKELEEVISLLMRHMNSIAVTLIERPDEFEPMFHGREVEGTMYTIVDEWCAGYLRGVALAKDAWAAGDPRMAEWLEPIRAFTVDTDWRGHETATDAEADQLREAITPNVRAIHAAWLAHRRDYTPPPVTSRRAEPRVGRNDPCPCGSGKKFKNCCLQ